MNFSLIKKNTGTTRGEKPFLLLVDKRHKEFEDSDKKCEKTANNRCRKINHILCMITTAYNLLTRNYFSRRI